MLCERDFSESAWVCQLSFKYCPIAYIRKQGELELLILKQVSQSYLNIAETLQSVQQQLTFPFIVFILPFLVFTDTLIWT